MLTSRIGPTVKYGDSPSFAYGSADVRGEPTSSLSAQLQQSKAALTVKQLIILSFASSPGMYARHYALLQVFEVSELAVAECDQGSAWPSRHCR